MPISPRPVLVASSLALVLAACGGTTTPEGSADAGAEGSASVEVTASFYPLEYLLTRVAGDHAEVSTLTAAGIDPHDLELSPRDVGSLGQSDLVVYSAGMQPAVDDAVASQAADNSFDASESADLLAVGESAEEHDEHAGESEEEHAEHAGESEEEHAEHADEEDAAAEEGHDDHGHGGEDPHFWLDPERYGDVALAMADRLGEVDPDNAQSYTSNAEAVVADLDALDEEFATGLADCTTRDLVTTHEAFGYLAARYDLDQVGITGISPESEPSAARLAEVTAQVDELGVGTIYAEPILTDAIADTVATETGAQVLVLDPLEGITDASAGEDYLEVMRSNLSALQEGLGCS